MERDFTKGINILSCGGAASIKKIPWGWGRQPVIPSWAICHLLTTGDLSELANVAFCHHASTKSVHPQPAAALQISASVSHIVRTSWKNSD